MAQIEFPHSSPDTLQREVQDVTQTQDVQAKYTKAEANYRPAGSSQTACWSCRFFQPGRPASCARVAGPIERSAVCDLWQRSQYLKDLVAAPGGTQVPQPGNPGGQAA